MNNQYIKASLFLSSYFETLGYYNGIWEFNYGFQNIEKSKDASFINYEIVHHFFALGGFDNIDITKFNSSDDTILMISTCKGLINGGKEINFIEGYLESFNLLKDNKRQSGSTTLDSLEFMRTNKSINKLKYDSKMGGNGASIRTSPIGLYFRNEKDIPKLIETSIIASRITHNHTIGFLGGLVTALFTNFAFRKLNITTWIEELLKLEDKIDNYMKTTNINKQYLEDKDKFFDKWRQYQELKVNNFKLRDKDFTTYQSRIESLKKFNHDEENFARFGSSGLSSTIYAYDSLLMAHTSKEYPYDLKNLDVSLDSLIFYSTLHCGDNDSIGIIAGAWYGALYGFNKFNEEKIKQLEFHNDIQYVLNKMK